MPLHDFLAGTAVDMSALAYFLDGLDGNERVREVRTLKAAELAKLFEAAAGFRMLALTDIVPAQVPSMLEVIHFGKNSLPVFANFEKRFCRPQDQQGQADQLWGYNQHPLKPLVGPGYFEVRQEDEYELLIDYTQLPPTKPLAWPAIVPNSARLGRYVYEGLADILRAVSQHVSIGRAKRAGTYVDNWFALCRAS